MLLEFIYDPQLFIIDDPQLFIVLGAGDLRGGLAVFGDRGLEFVDNSALVVAEGVGLERRLSLNEDLVVALGDDVLVGLLFGDGVASVVLIGVEGLRGVGSAGGLRELEHDLNSIT